MVKWLYGYMVLGSWFLVIALSNRQVDPTFRQGS